MAAASKDELKPLRLLGRSGFNATGVKPTFFRIGVRKNRRADIDALARDSFGSSAGERHCSQRRETLQAA